jgi:hypothetical protein
VEAAPAPSKPGTSGLATVEVLGRPVDFSGFTAFSTRNPRWFHWHARESADSTQNPEAGAASALLAYVGNTRASPPWRHGSDKGDPLYGQSDVTTGFARQFLPQSGAGQRVEPPLRCPAARGFLEVSGLRCHTRLAAAGTPLGVLDAASRRPVSHRRALDRFLGA